MNNMVLSDRWVGRNNASLDTLSIRALKNHLFAGNVALVGNGTEFLAVLAPGFKQHNTTRSGVTLSIQIQWRSSPILCDSVNRHNGIFISRVPYMRKTLFSCNVFTLISINESYDEVYRNRSAYPVKIRPSFAAWVAAALEVTCTFFALGCRVSTGIIAPLVGLMWKIPLPAIVFSMVMLTAAVAVVTEFPFRDVANFVMPFGVYAWDPLLSFGQFEWGAEGTVLLCFILFTLSLCCVCACEEVLTRTYPVTLPATAPPKPLNQLNTPVVSLSASDDDKASGSTSDHDPDNVAWQKETDDHGLFASTRDAHCILIDGLPERRLNPKVCIRRGVKLATLLDTDELFSSGSRITPSCSDWVDAQLRTFRREPYIQEREKRRCHIDDCFRAGVSIALFGTVTKRCRNHIEQDQMEIRSGRPIVPALPDPVANLVGGSETILLAARAATVGISNDVLPPLHEGPVALAWYRGVSKPSSMSDTCIRLDKLHEDNRSTVNLRPSCWQADTTSLPAAPEAVKRPSLPSGGAPLQQGSARPPGLTPSSSGRLPSLTVSYPGVDTGLPSSLNTSHLDLSGLMPTSVKRPREGIQPDTYPFETLSKPKQSTASTDPMGIMMGRMGERMGELGQTNNKEMKLERFQEYVVFSTRGFGHFKTTIGTGCYSGELEAALKRQSVTHRRILSRQGIRVPVTNRIARACPLLDWGLDYGSTPAANTLMLNDFVP